MRKSTNSAFTLVELIVVITILAVLGTIAFISLQGYSADARNSKRTSDINNIQSAMWIKQAEGGSLVAFVKDTPASKLLVADTSFGGTGAVLTWANQDYYAGTLNYTALGVKEDEFKDPNGQEYRMGLTNTAKGRFELAASVEDGAEKVALVKGTYTARTATGYAIQSKSNNVVTLKGAGTNAFSRGDIVDLRLVGAVIAANANMTIQKVARDGITLTFDSSITLDSTADNVILNSDESKWLIKVNAAAGTGAVTNGTAGIANQPY